MIDPFQSLLFGRLQRFQTVRDNNASSLISCIEDNEHPPDFIMGPIRSGSVPLFHQVAKRMESFSIYNTPFQLIRTQFKNNMYLHDFKSTMYIYDFKIQHIDHI